MQLRSIPQSLGARVSETVSSLCVGWDGVTEIDRKRRMTYYTEITMGGDEINTSIRLLGA